MTLLELSTAADTLDKAIYAGVLQVRFGERWIKYQSLTDMRKARSDLNAQIATLASPAQRSMCTLAEFDG